MEARVVSPLELSAGEAGLWRELQADRPELNSPFFNPEFAQAIARARSDARVAVLTSAGRTIGFFPFHRLRGGVGKPIGGPISDYQGPLLARDAQVLAEDLLRACDLTSYDFNHLPIATTVFSRGNEHLSESPYIDLSKGYAAYAAGASKAVRHELKEVERRRRKFEREVGPLIFNLDDKGADVWDWLVEMKSASLRRLRVPTAFDVEWVSRAMAAIRSESGENFAGVLSTVRTGDRLIAAHFGMRNRTTMCWWFNTYDYELRDRSPGLLLLHMAMERAPENGIGIIDFGRGEESYKRKFATGSTALCEGSIEIAHSVPGALRRTQKFGLRLIERMPLGHYQSWPRRAMNRVLTGGVRLPA